MRTAVDSCITYEKKKTTRVKRTVKLLQNTQTTSFDQNHEQEGANLYKNEKTHVILCSGVWPDCYTHTYWSIGHTSTQAFLLLVLEGLATTQSFQILVLQRLASTQVISTFGTSGTRENSVISVFGQSFQLLVLQGLASTQVISAFGTPGTREHSSHFSLRYSRDSGELSFQFLVPQILASTQSYLLLILQVFWSPVFSTVEHPVTFESTRAFQVLVLMPWCSRVLRHFRWCYSRDWVIKNDWYSRVIDWVPMIGTCTLTTFASFNNYAKRG